ncbi:MAG: rhomboid family intramembrane serine protease [Bacteroidales bacterium]|nr:rhomboid family intramembrane serine protease [Bacteroidales bacterium]
MEDKAERKKFFGSLVIPACIVAVMWAVKIIEVALGLDGGRFGLRPHSIQGLVGILTLPFLHGSWEHLISNSIPILVLGTTLYYCYPTLANRVMLITYIASGVLTWCLGSPGSTHIGASALVYGLNLFLITSGFIRGNRMLTVIALIVVFLYGGFVWGMIPDLAILQNISWEGHLSGAIVGVVLALLLRKEGPQKEIHHWEEDEEENELGASAGPATDDSENQTAEKPYWDVPTPSNDELTVQYRIRH